MRKISQKISLAIISSVLVVSILIGGVSVVKSRSIIEKNTENNMLEISKNLAAQIYGETHNVEQIVNDLAVTIAYDVDMDKMQRDPQYQSDYSNKIVPLVTRYAEAGRINVDCYVNFLNEYAKDGLLIGPNIINQDGSGFKRVNFGTKIADMQSDKTEYDWYYKPIELKKGYWTELYVDPITSYYMVSYTAPIVVQGVIVGIVGMDVKFSTLQSIVSEAKVYSTGYAALIDSNYNFLVHPLFKNTDNLRTVNNGELKNLADYISIHPNGIFKTKVSGFEKYIGFSTLGNGNILLLSVPSDEVLQAAHELTNETIYVSILVAFLAGVLALYISSHISTPIRKLKVYADEIIRGNYGAAFVVQSNDEIGQFAMSFSLMTDNLITSNEKLTVVYESLSDAEVELRHQYEALSNSEFQLRNSEERYRLAVDGSNDVIWEIDLITHAFYASEKLYELNGYPLNCITSSMMLIDYIYPEDAKRVSAELAAYLNGKTTIYKSEYRIKKSDGGFLWVFSRGKAIWDDSGVARKIAGSISDYTDKKVAEEHIKFMAYNDSLTKLPNRANFVEKVSKALEYAASKNTEGAAYFIDLDNFKYINDTLGHEFGDQVLIEISKKLVTILSKNDMVFRLGGDEFVLIHPHSDPHEIERFSNKILEIINTITEVLKKTISLTTSIGIAVYPKDGADVEMLLKNADVALYKAKQRGKNRFELYNEDMYLQIKRKTSVERVLRHAIENHELSVFYQPQYQASDRVLYGYEALARLNSKELGPISPAEFIPIAEESGLIIKIDRWIFHEVCLKTAQWIQRGYPINSMSINISSLDMQQPDFMENIKQVIQETGLEPGIIELEITETILMESIDSKIEILRELKEHGIRIALDDFGTGYSSLNYLRIIPISTLKIDKSFVDNILSSNKEKAIVNNIIQMAHGLELKVVAEGVEAEEQYALLRDKGCDYIQGYYLSKPLPENEIEELL